MTRIIDGEVVILDRDAGQIHQLNAAASCVWNACDGGHSAEEIAAHVAASFEGVSDRVLQDVQAALADFYRLGLLVDGPAGDQSERQAAGEA